MNKLYDIKLTKDEILTVLELLPDNAYDRSKIHHHAILYQKLHNALKEAN